VSKKLYRLNPASDYGPERWSEFPPEREVMRRFASHYWFRYAASSDFARETEALKIRRMKRAIGIDL